MTARREHPPESVAVVALETCQPVSTGLVDRLAHVTQREPGGHLRSVGRRELEGTLPASDAGGLEGLTGRVEHLLDTLDSLGGTDAVAGMALHPLHGASLEAVRERAWEACATAHHQGLTLAVWHPRPETGQPSPTTDQHPTSFQAVVNLHPRTLRGARVGTLGQRGYGPPGGRHRRRWHRAVVEALRSWHELGEGVPVQVRVPAGYRSHRLVDTVSDALVEAGQSPANLVLELSDRHHLPWSALRGPLQEVRTAGVRVHLIDFGAGHTPWIQLRQLPVDALVVDSGLLRRVERQPVAEAFLNATGQAAGALGCDAGAYGVSSLATAEFLLEHGFCFATGPLWDLNSDRDRRPAHGEKADKRWER